MIAFWADEKVELIVGRHRAPYVVSDEKTPSGKIHVGALRGVVLHDAMARALKEAGHGVRYIYDFDDYDPLDKIPAGLDKDDYQKYVAMPMSEVPEPDKDGKPSSHPVDEKHNFGRFFADEFEGVYRQLGVESETLRTSMLYKKGDFNQAIQIALDSASEINAIYEEVIAHRTEDRKTKKAVSRELPINMVCQNCRKIASTRPLAWNGQEVEYECASDVQPFAQGCNFKGKNSPLGGKAKLPWKVEWAAKWFIWKTDVEGAGKDHYTKGGSRDVALAIFNRVYSQHLSQEHSNQPVDLFYEWFYLGGAKMSTSRGYGVFASDIIKQIPAELLRFLMVRTKPKSAVNFDPKPEAILSLFDEYDRFLTAFHQNSNSQEGKVFNLARLRDVKDLPMYTMKFSKVVWISQLEKFSDRVDLLKDAEAEKGSPLTVSEKDELTQRKEFAGKWLEGAPEQYRLSLNSQPVDLSEKQQEFLRKILSYAESQQELISENLHGHIHNLKEALDISPKEAFSAVYQVFLGRNSGPQAGWLLAALGKDRVISRIKKVLS